MKQNPWDVKCQITIHQFRIKVFLLIYKLWGFISKFWGNGKNIEKSSHCTSTLGHETNTIVDKHWIQWNVHRSIIFWTNDKPLSILENYNETKSMRHKMSDYHSPNLGLRFCSWFISFEALYLSFEVQFRVRVL